MKSIILTLTILLFSDNLYSDDRDMVRLANADLRQAGERLKTLSEKARRKEIIYKVIECESSFRHKNIWGLAGEYGLLQYKEQSFYYLMKLSPYKKLKLKWKDVRHQYLLASWAIENGYGNHWTCYRKYAT